MVVVDTDLVIGVLRGDEDAIRAYERHERVIISVFTWYELMVGCCKVEDTRAHLQHVMKCLGETRLLHMDDTIATLAARNAVILSKRGQPTGVVDNFIAASCVVNGEKLVTRNVKHFEGIPGLEVEAW